MNNSRFILRFSIIFSFIISLFSPLFWSNNGFISIISPQKVYIFPLIGSLFLFISLFFYDFNNKIIRNVSLGLSLLSLVIFICLRYVVDIDASSLTLGAGLFFLYLVNAISIFINLRSFFDLNEWSINDVVEIGVFVSLAIILDMPFCKIKIVSNGGSISFSMVPLLLMSIRKGFYKGFIGCGVIFGLITCLLDGYGIITFPLDYLCAFGSLSIFGLFVNIFNLNNKKFIHYLFLVIGYFASILLRTLFATLSGILIYQLDFMSSLLYQLAYILPSSLLVLIALIVLYKPFSFLNKKFSK